MPHEKSSPTSPEAQSGSPAQENLQALATLFPSVVRDGQVDVDALRQLCGEAVPKDNELFGLNWRGKAEVRRAALTPSLGTLRPCKEESKDWDTTRNLYIEGDNLEVLKLLRKSYGGRVKMIYIDPPYNTGKEFVYPDDYQNGIENYKKLTGQEGKFSANVETSGRYHTDWLNMMYPRLALARDLLSNDGLIVVSISEVELANLKAICDECFGEEHLLAVFLWKKKGTTSNVENAECSSLTDYQLCYKKTSTAKFKPRVKKAETRQYPHHDDEGAYRTQIIEKKDSGSYKRESMKFEILGHTPREGKRWQIGIEKARELESNNRLIWDGEKIVQKVYNFEDRDTFSAHPNLLDFVGSTDEAARMVNTDLFGVAELFDNPKPTGLVNFFIKHALNNQSLVLDFFSGSATTAHAVMKLNAEDGGNRRFIMVQLPEPCDEKSEAYKAGYMNICEIGKERIRRAGEKVKEEAGLAGQNLDIGFRVYKLDSSNVKAWNPQAEDLATAVNNYAEHLVGGRTEDDFLTEIMLKSGIDLVEEVQEREIAGHRVQSLGYGQYYACMAADLADNEEDVALGIAAWHEEDCAFAGGEQQDTCTVFVSDRAFASNDAAKMNFVAILEQHGICNIKAL